jgi:putative DNA primase/helicase
VFDSLTFLAKGPENEAEFWDPIADWIVSHRRHGRTILFVHHQGRSGKARGTSKREDGIEVSVALKARDDLADDDYSAFELVFDKHRGFFGSDAAPRIVRYSLNDDGIDWRYETKQENVKSRVSELLGEGWKQVDIAKELHLTKGRVSQIVKELER